MNRKCELVSDARAPITEAMRGDRHAKASPATNDPLPPFLALFYPLLLPD